MKFIQLKSKDITDIRHKILHEDQDGLCAICTKEIHEKSGASLDHQHRTKSSEIGHQGGGLVRGVLCRNCNVFEGKIWNNSKRFGMHDELSDWLRSLADYLDKENYGMIHPSEEPKEPKMSKRNYNKLKKEYGLAERRAKFPEFPKSGKVTVKLKALFEEFEISPYN